MTLAVIARADSSGLAHLTGQVIDRLQPERILVVDLGMRNRGQFDAHRYDGPGRRTFVVAHPYGWTDATVAAFLQSSSKCFSAETFYWPPFPDLARSYGVETHLYVMPELYNRTARELRADHAWLPCPTGPTDPRSIRAHVLPWWAPTDYMFHPSHHEAPVTFVHPTSIAMADRNGTRSLLAAAAHVQTECRIVLVGTTQPEGERWQVGPVTVEHHPRVDHWTDLYMLGDVLVLPRRFGWLSLPMFEAPAMGVPVITTDVWPQCDWFARWPDLLVEVVRSPTAVPMKGGSILVQTAHPEYLAAAIDRLAAQPKQIRQLSIQFRQWAVDHDWSTVEAAWMGALR